MGEEKVARDGSNLQVPGYETGDSESWKSAIGRGNAEARRLCCFVRHDCPVTSGHAINYRARDRYRISLHQLEQFGERARRKHADKGARASVLPLNAEHRWREATL